MGGSVSPESRRRYAVRFRERYATDPQLRARKNEQRRRWRKTNPDKERAAKARWRVAHPDKFEAMKRRSTQRRKERYDSDPVYRESIQTRVREYGKRNGRRIRLERKRKAMEFLGGAFCARCGIDDIRILEVNHIRPTWVGRRDPKDRTNHAGDRFYSAIINGDLDRSALNVLCRPCNAIDYIEKKFPDLVGLRVVGAVPCGTEAD